MRATISPVGPRRVQGMSQMAWRRSTSRPLGRRFFIALSLTIPKWLLRSGGDQFQNFLDSLIGLHWRKNASARFDFHFTLRQRFFANGDADRNAHQFRI